MKTVWIYVDANGEVGNHPKLFARRSLPMRENDPEGVVFGSKAIEE
jgi:hypothetical protein